MYDDDAISQMKAIKRSFDPNGILNRGNRFKLICRKLFHTAFESRLKSSIW